MCNTWERNFINSEYNSISMRKKGMDALIWLSCLGEPKTIGSLVKEWGYSSPTSFYRGDPAKELKKKNLLKVIKKKDEKTGRKEKFYYSIFDGYFEAIKDNIGESEKSILKDKNVYKKVLSSEKMRETFFDLEKIKILFDKKPKVGQSFGFKTPLWIVGLLNTFHYFSNNFKTNKKLYDLLFRGFAWKIGLGVGILAGIKTSTYFYEIMDEIGLDEFEKNINEIITKDVEKTAYYREFSKRIDKIEPFLKNLFESM